MHCHYASKALFMLAELQFTVYSIIAGRRRSVQVTTYKLQQQRKAFVQRGRVF